MQYANELFSSTNENRVINMKSLRLAWLLPFSDMQKIIMFCFDVNIDIAQSMASV
jgi:hypothetical protein